MTIPQDFGMIQRKQLCALNTDGNKKKHPRVEASQMLIF